MWHERGVNFEQALTIDPTYARAWVGLAGTYWVESDEPMSEETLLQWRDAIERALRFAPNQPEAHVRAAQDHWKNGDLPRGDEHFARARALNSSDLLVLAVAAGHAIVQGRLDEGIALQRQAVAVDPLAASYRGNLASFLMAAGEWE
jgi:Tfp pilus assembly protein PilF